MPHTMPPSDQLVANPPIGVIEKAPKTEAGRRSVAIPPAIVDELVERLAAHVEPDLAALVLPKGYKPLRTAWDNARRSVGVAFTFHDLRHSGLTWAAATGATTAELMHRGGHRSVEAAMRYQHATADRDRAVADAMAALSQPAPDVELRTEHE